jgi:hypothetical protein
MSDEMIDVRTSVPGYAGHADVISRRRSDQQVRAWVGERLAALRERLPLDGTTEAFDDALFHCQFGDQHVIKTLEDAHFGDDATAAAVEAEDAQLIAAAAGSERVDAAGLAAFITGVSDALRARTAAIIALKR